MKKVVFNQSTFFLSIRNNLIFNKKFKLHFTKSFIKKSLKISLCNITVNKQIIIHIIEQMF